MKLSGLRNLLVALSTTVMLGGLAQAGCLDKPLRGVNLSGGEFGHQNIPGTLFRDYIYPTQKDLQFFRSQGATVIRVPFLWERLQREPMGALNAADLAQLQNASQWAKDLGLCLVLDLHNYGKYQGKTVGSAELPIDAFVDIWKKLAAAFPDPQWTALGLMNEPVAVLVPQWLAIAQETVLALRAADARHLVLVPTGRWSGAHEFHKTFGGVSAAEVLRTFRDPLNNFAIELHQYADAGYSGTSASCLPADELKTTMSRVTQWAEQENKRLFLGEFGVANNPACLEALKAQLESMRSSAWLGWTYWSAGPWWGNYAYSIQPSSHLEPAQLQVIRPFLAP